MIGKIYWLPDEDNKGNFFKILNLDKDVPQYFYTLLKIINLTIFIHLLLVGKEYLINGKKIH